MSNITKLQTNNTGLQAILNSVNALTPTTLETWYCTLEDGTVVAKDIVVFYLYVRINNISNGTIAAIENTRAGATVTLTPTPDEGYKYGGATVTYTLDGVEQTITLDANTTTFTMPAADVTVTPVWSEKPTTVEIKVNSQSANDFAYITYNGVRYYNVDDTTFTANVGDVIQIYIRNGEDGYGAEIRENYKVLASIEYGRVDELTYDYVISTTTPLYFDCWNEHDGGMVDITEWEQ